MSSNDSSDTDEKNTGLPIPKIPKKKAIGKSTKLPILCFFDGSKFPKSRNYLKNLIHMQSIFDKIIKIWNR